MLNISECVLPTMAEIQLVNNWCYCGVTSVLCNLIADYYCIYRIYVVREIWWAGYIPGLQGVPHLWAAACNCGIFCGRGGVGVIYLSIWNVSLMRCGANAKYYNGIIDLRSFFFWQNHVNFIPFPCFWPAMQEINIKITCFPLHSVFKCQGLDIISNIIYTLKKNIFEIF